MKPVSNSVRPRHKSTFFCLSVLPNKLVKTTQDHLPRECNSSLFHHAITHTQLSRSTAISRRELFIWIVAKLKLSSESRARSPLFVSIRWKKISSQNSTDRDVVSPAVGTTMNIERKKRWEKANIDDRWCVCTMETWMRERSEWGEEHTKHSSRWSRPRHTCVNENAQQTFITPANIEPVLQREKM